MTLNWKLYVATLKELYYNNFVVHQVGSRWLWTYLGDYEEDNPVYYTTSDAYKYLQTFVEYKVQVRG